MFPINCEEIIQLIALKFPNHFIPTAQLFNENSASADIPHVADMPETNIHKPAFV